MSRLYWVEDKASEYPQKWLMVYSSAIGWADFGADSTGKMRGSERSKSIQLECLMLCVGVNIASKGRGGLLNASKPS